MNKYCYMHCALIISRNDKNLMLQGGHGSDAIKSCSDLLEMDPDSIDGHCDRAEAHIANENYDAGKS